MKKFFLFCGSLLVLLCSCKQKKQKQEDFLPAIPFIQNDIRKVDTSFYSIQKITWQDNLSPDTVFVKREEFRGLAIDFLQLPDITEKKYKNRFTGEKFFDQSLNAVIFTYKPIEPDKEEIQKQEILVTPGLNGDQVKTIIVDWVIDHTDSTVIKRMLWQIDKSFQVTTTIQKLDFPDQNHTLKVVWNEPTNH